MLATGLSIVPFENWWVRVFDFPRGQIAVAGLIILALYLFFWDRKRLTDVVVMALLLTSVGYQAYRMYPFTPLAPEQVLTAERAPADSTFSLLVANVLMDNREAERFLDLAAAYDPDIVLVLEPDAWWEQQLRPLEEDYPHVLKRPLDNTYGMLLYSRLELVDPEIKELVKDSIPSMHAQARLRSGHLVQLHFLHPDPPNPKYAKETTERDAELLIVGKEVEARGGPTVVAGDFNDVAWSYTTRLFQETSGLLDPRIGRGTFSTFHAKNPLLRWPLDHVFHSNHFKLVRLERGPAWGSDHFPIYAELAMDPEAEWQQREPEAEPEDREQAEEKIQRAGQKDAL